MGLHVPGAALPLKPISEMLSPEAVKQLVENAQKIQPKNRISDIVNEKSIVNAMIGLLATGGSTNHTIHLPAIARAAFILTGMILMSCHKLCHLSVKFIQTAKPI